MTFVRLQSLTTGRWFVDPRLRPMLVQAAAENQTSMTEMVTMILCEHLSITHIPNGRRTKPREDDHVLNVNLPEEVEVELASRYARRGGVQAGVREILSQHFGLPAPSRARGTKTPV